MFVLLFVYVFGGAIQTPGFDYVDFLMPGIIVQSIAFGGFVTALGLSEDVQKGLIDRFRSLPMSRAAVLTGRTLSDVLLNCLSLSVLLGVGFICRLQLPGHDRRPRSCSGSSCCCCSATRSRGSSRWSGCSRPRRRPRTRSASRLIFPLTFASSAFVPAESMPDGLQQFAERQPVHDGGRRRALAVARHARQQRRLDGVPVVRRAAGDLRAAGRSAATGRSPPSRASGTLSRCAFDSSQRVARGGGRGGHAGLRRDRAGAGEGVGRPSISGDARPRRAASACPAAGRRSGSIPAKLPDGIVLGDGFVSVSTTSSSDGTATRPGRGRRPRAVRRRRHRVDRRRAPRRRPPRASSTAAACATSCVGEREIGSVERSKTYTFDAGKVVVNTGGAGLTRDADRRPERLPGRDEGRRRRRLGERAAPRRDPTPTADRDADRRADRDAPRPSRPRRPKPREHDAGWKKRLMSKPLRLPGRRARRRSAGRSAPSAPTPAPTRATTCSPTSARPVVAVADGTIENVGSLPISGNRLWVYADGGDQFFYAHLASFAPGGGQRPPRRGGHDPRLHRQHRRRRADPAAPALRDPPRRRQGRRPERRSWSPGRSAPAPP